MSRLQTKLLNCQWVVQSICVRQNRYYVFVVDINECDSYPCLNGGTCSDDVNSFSCVCAPGITGLTCNTVISMFY